MARHVVVMGVSGSGKSTIAGDLAGRLGAAFVEGDLLHPPANVERMSAGIPLTDADRWPWLDRVVAAMAARDAAGRDSVVSCSALKRAYRDMLRRAPGRVRFVHLHGPVEVLEERLAGRVGHFMPPGLLASQLATLEPLGPDEDGITLPLELGPDVLAELALEWLR